MQIPQIHVFFNHRRSPKAWPKETTSPLRLYFNTSTNRSPQQLLVVTQRSF